MLGFRGASRYIMDSFRGTVRAGMSRYEVCALMLNGADQRRKTCALSCRTVVKPKRFCRSYSARETGLKRGENGLAPDHDVRMPANALLQRKFLEHFDGFVHRLNDLTQLTLALIAIPRIIPTCLTSVMRSVQEGCCRWPFPPVRAADKYIGILRGRRPRITRILGTLADCSRGWKAFH